ncbi:O-antigen polysaccharide polymerase Wzy [Janthinobacterium lividum]|uniref:O-antigen polysaccharide polymerase Wzy n=1 Tax=Janthinobacterium sp. LB2P10 TaxID=3424194 RepID=UPI000288F409
MSYSLRVFVGIWILYFVMVSLAPAHSRTSEMGQVVFLDAGFVVLTSLVAVLTNYFLERKLRVDSGYYLEQVQGVSDKLIRLTLLLALVGLLALMFDKIQVQHIDYGGSLARAREEWRELGEGREGVSSPYSMIGYAFSTCFILTLIPLILNPKFLRPVKVGSALLGLFFFLMLNSILIGGRSIILLTLCFAIAFYVIRLERGGQAFTFSKKTKIGLIILAGVAIIYIFYVFMARASATHDGVSGAEYLQAMQEYMRLKTSAWPALLEREFPTFGSLVAFGMLTVTYLCHSAFIFAEYLQHQTDYASDSFILFNHMRDIFAKLGLIGPQSNDWFLAGRFPSLPGALFHDGGYILLFLGALVLGGVVGVANFFTKAKQMSFVRIGFVSSVYTILFLSPLLFAGDIMSFPFIVFEFIMFGVFFSKFRITK